MSKDKFWRFKFQLTSSLKSSLNSLNSIVYITKYKYTKTELCHFKKETELREIYHEWNWMNCEYSIVKQLWVIISEKLMTTEKSYILKYLPKINWTLSLVPGSLKPLLDQFIFALE